MTDGPMTGEYRKDLEIKNQASEIARIFGAEV